MKLGNTGGKNKGKKYLKITGNEIVTEENRQKANSFAIWFGNHYERLQRELIAKNTIDEDQMNETYLKIFEKILYGGLEILDYKSYFHRAFFTNYIQSSVKKNRIERAFLTEDHAVVIIDESDEEAERNALKDELYKDVLQYVRNKTDEAVYNLFINYVTIGKNRYEHVAAEMNLPVDKVADTLVSLKQSIRKNKHFRARRRDM